MQLCWLHQLCTPGQCTVPNVSHNLERVTTVETSESVDIDQHMIETLAEAYCARVPYETKHKVNSLTYSLKEREFTVWDFRASRLDNIQLIRASLNIIRLMTAIASRYLKHAMARDESNHHGCSASWCAVVADHVHGKRSYNGAIISPQQRQRACSTLCRPR